MEFNGLLVFAAIWFLLSLLGKSQEKKRKQKAQPPRALRTRLPSEAGQPLSGPGAPDATQREGSRLELVLREFERALEQAGAVERPPPPPLSFPTAEEVEARESLEVEPEVVSLETEVHREGRRRIDQDDEAEQIEIRRISAAAARDRASAKADHVEFDKRIRQEAADKTAAPGKRAITLRDAVVWREILGPPVSLRDGER